MLLTPGPVKVSAPGTPVNLSAAVRAAFPQNLGYQFQSFQAVLLQALPANAGSVYIGGAGLNKTTLAACVAVLVAPGSGQPGSFAQTNPLSPAGVDLGALWLDADQANDGVLVSLQVT